MFNDNFMESKFGLISLPNELQEKIIEYLTFFDKDTLANYSTCNKIIMNICDNFFRRKAQLENIPPQLLPKHNIMRLYIELRSDINCIRESHELKEECCLIRAIRRDDISRVLWLVELTMETEKPIDKKITIYSELIEYAFKNGKNAVGKYLISSLFRSKLISSERGSHYMKLIWRCFFLMNDEEN